MRRKLDICELKAPHHRISQPAAHLNHSVRDKKCARFAMQPSNIHKPWPDKSGKCRPSDGQDRAIHVVGPGCFLALGRVGVSKVTCQAARPQPKLKWDVDGERPLPWSCPELCVREFPCKWGKVGLHADAHPGST